MKNRITRPLVVLGVAALALTACTTADPDPESTAAAGYDCASPSADTMTDVTVTVLPILSNGAIYLGMDKGFFAKHGIELEPQAVANVPATVSSLQGGTTDFVFTGTLPLLQAIDSGVDAVVVAPFAGIAPGYWEKMQAGEKGYETEVTALLVPDGSDIKDPGDLDGMTISVTDAQGQAELTTRAVIRAHGGDPDSVSFVVMSPADSYNALLAGNVDAAYSIAPFFNGYEEAGMRIISWVGVEALHEGPTSIFAARADFVENNTETVERFNCAIREASAYANEHQDEVRTTMAEVQDVDPGTFAAAVVPYFYSTIDLDGIDRFQDMMLDEGLLSGRIDTESIIFAGALADGAAE